MDYKKYLQFVLYTAISHQDHTNEFGKKIRTGVEQSGIPYFFHPLWCSVMVYMEPMLSEKTRYDYSLALLFHDILEDTTKNLPKELSENIKKLVSELTVPRLPEYNFSSWNLEKTTLLKKPVDIQLLKLYDKVASMYDMALSQQRLKEWCDLVEKVSENVEKEYGELNIVLLAKSLIKGIRKRHNLT